MIKVLQPFETPILTRRTNSIQLKGGKIHRKLASKFSEKSKHKK
jgi:hypothetical protein